MFLFNLLNIIINNKNIKIYNNSGVINIHEDIFSCKNKQKSYVLFNIFLFIYSIKYIFFIFIII